MKKIAVLQSNYIPWKGYFDLINMVDEFILYDSVQYTKNDWRNRNKIQTNQGLKWLTIPIRQNSLKQKISETQISDNRWSVKHWKTICQNYSNAKYFHIYKEQFEKIYLNNSEEYLSQINYKFIVEICKILNIETLIRWDSEFNLIDGRTEKLISICKQCDASIYLSGPSAKNYFNEEKAKKSNIEVEWMDYNNYKEYNQLNSPFAHDVTILDLIFNNGPNSKNFMKSFK